jgi:methionine-rich copper-binding protein CopC
MLDAAARRLKGMVRVDRVKTSALPATRSSRVAALVAVILVAFAVLAVPASPALAHDELIGSDPAPGAEVDALPTALTLTFSGAIATDAGASVVEVTDAEGTSLTDGEPSAQDNVLTQPLVGEASGAVKVLWKVVSSDGHPISGELSFTVAGAPMPSESPDPLPTPTDGASNPVESPEPTTEPTAAPIAAKTDPTPWIIGGIVLLLVGIGALVYSLASRSRREKARLAAGQTATPTESEPPAAG